MPPDATVVVEDLHVVRGGVRAVDGVSVTVHAGSITGLLGPSGSGKTTLMRAIVGSQRITTGRVTVMGHPAGTAEVRPLIGYMSQVPAVYSDLTVDENLRYFARIVGAEGARVDEIVHRMDLEERRSALARTLSGGEENRLSLGVAMLGRPALLVLDEPTVGLDPILRRSLWDQFRALADDGVALLVSSHVMDEAERCDRLLLMRDGRLLFDGDRAGLADRAGSSDIETAFIRLADGEQP